MARIIHHSDDTPVIKNIREEKVSADNISWLPDDKAVRKP